MKSSLLPLAIKLSLPCSAFELVSYTNNTGFGQGHPLGYITNSFNSRHMALQSPLLLPYIHYTHASPSMAVAAHHPHLDTLSPFLPIPAGHAQWTNIELASGLVAAKSTPRRLRWYGMVWSGWIGCRISG